ncbi:MAG: hypothetical protein LUG91_04135 [Ruminococcus sp.]|nr:hypothetical protein [Ruminococcus sp.]
MDNLIEIKEELDIIYHEYKNNKSQFRANKSKNTAKLIADIVFSKSGSPHDVAVEIARFSAKVAANFFEIITRDRKAPFKYLEAVLKELLEIDTDSKLSQYYVPKFTSAIISMIRCYKDEVNHSTILPELVEFIAHFAAKSDKNKEKFCNLINNSAGKIFKLDYSSINKNSLLNIWNVTNNIYPDLTQSKYESLIYEWGKKYGFIKDVNTKASNKQNNSVKIEKTTISNKSSSEMTNNSKKHDAASTTTSDESYSKITDQVLYERIKKDIDKEQKAIITAFADMISPVGKAFEAIQGEISKSREIGAENVTLNAKITDLEKRLSEQKDREQTANQSLETAQAENDELKRQISFLESQNSELDSKLNDAYAINSRESSLEAEKIRLELKKAFTFLYEDWLEYEFSDVSEENYKSLQAIIKKIFRSLERNGIDFKGNN